MRFLHTWQLVSGELWGAASLKSLLVVLTLDFSANILLLLTHCSLSMWGEGFFAMMFSTEVFGDSADTWSSNPLLFFHRQSCFASAGGGGERRTAAIIFV